LKTIEITVTPSGQTTVETKGFSGSECRQASQFIETALGQRTGERLTNDFYAQVGQEQRLQEGT
jgi:hypothetical protein